MDRGNNKDTWVWRARLERSVISWSCFQTVCHQRWPLTGSALITVSWKGEAFVRQLRRAESEVLSSAEPFCKHVVVACVSCCMRSDHILYLFPSLLEKFLVPSVNINFARAGQIARRPQSPLHYTHYICPAPTPTSIVRSHQICPL